MVSENLSKLNLSAANSSKYGLYRVSESDVRLDVKAMGWDCIWVVPWESTHSNRCVKTPANPSLHPSVVTVNDEPLYLGPLSTGELVSAILRVTNALSCSEDHWFCS